MQRRICKGGAGAGRRVSVLSENCGRVAGITAISAEKPVGLATTILLGGVTESSSGQTWQQGRGPGRGVGVDGAGVWGSLPQQWWHMGRFVRSFGAGIRTLGQHHPGGKAKRNAAATITNFGQKARI